MRLCWLSLTLLLWLPPLPGMAARDDIPNCLGCHTVSADVAVHAVFQTVHGGLGGGGNGSCAGCHGASEEHARNPAAAMPGISFGPRWQSPAEARTDACLGCHSGGSPLHWVGSEHQREGMACDSCHDSHRQQDPALSDSGSQQACLSCHTRVQAELLLPSRHPIAGSLGDASLHQASVSDNCLQCHQDKRGPFLWEHPPASEDCALCHRPHGAVHDRLLTARGPALCQQCHVAAFHPSLPYGAEGLAGGSGNQNVLGKNCLNCHSQVHGSNHPSGARLTR